MKIRIGQNISFRLDGNWYGEGVVQDIEQETLDVRLTANCKEFLAGTCILVDKHEVLEF